MGRSRGECEGGTDAGGGGLVADDRALGKVARDAATDPELIPVPRRRISDLMSRDREAVAPSSERVGDRSQRAGSPVVHASHQELADELHSSREVISRLLKQMEREGLVRMGRQQVELLRP